MNDMYSSETYLTLNQSYEPYGTTLASQMHGASRYGFAGEWTEETGLIYRRAWYYAPDTAAVQGVAAEYSRG